MVADSSEGLGTVLQKHFYYFWLNGDGCDGWMDGIWGGWGAGAKSRGKLLA